MNRPGFNVPPGSGTLPARAFATRPLLEDITIERLQLCTVEEIDPDTGKEVEITVNGERHYLMMLRRDDRVFAYHNECPHQGRALNYAIDRFLLKEERVICPHHGATFAIEDGRCLGGACRGVGLRSVAVEVREGVVCCLEGDLS